jgi:prevent-host-death family protein
MADSVNIHDAKTHLSRLVERAANGERIVIARAGRPIADLVPHLERTIRFGTWAGRIEYDDESFNDFDPEILAMFYGDDAASR